MAAIGLTIDTSFLVSLLVPEEPFHDEAEKLYLQILPLKNKIRIIIPSIVFFETIFTLTKIGKSQEIIKTMLSKLLYEDQIFNVNLAETSAFRLFKRFPKNHMIGFKTSDYIVLCTALAFDSHLLTFDKKFRRNAGKSYKKIVYSNSTDGEFFNDVSNFYKILK